MEIDVLEGKWFCIIRHTISSNLSEKECLTECILSMLLDLLKVNSKMGLTRRLYGIGNSMSVSVSKLIRCRHDESLCKSKQKLLSDGVKRKYHIIMGYDSETKRGEIQPYYKQSTFYLYCKSEYSLPSSRRLIYMDIRDSEAIISLLGDNPLFHKNHISSMMTEMDQHYNERPSCHCCR